MKLFHVTTICAEEVYPTGGCLFFYWETLMCRKALMHKKIKSAHGCTTWWVELINLQGWLSLLPSLFPFTFASKASSLKKMNSLIFFSVLLILQENFMIATTHYIRNIKNIFYSFSVVESRNFTCVISIFSQ